MKRSNILPVIFLLLAVAVYGQRAPLSGTILLDNAGLGGVFVINSAAQAEVKTNAKGEFTITAQPGDRLIIYSPNIVKREFVLSTESFKNQPLQVSVNAQAYELNEVVMDRDRSVDEVSLGLVPANQKQYTPAERKLYTATTGLLDPLINKLSGRTEMLKRDVKTEKKEMLLQEIDYLVTEEEIIKDMKIPAEYVGGFLYYVVEDKRFSQAMGNNSRVEARFLMNGLALDYLKLLKENE